MRLIISFVIAGLFCFVLVVPAEAQQRKKRKTPQQKVSQPQQSKTQDATNQSNQPATQPQTAAKEKEETSSQETVGVKFLPPCLSDERIKEDEEITKQAEEMVKQIETNPDYRPPRETIKTFQSFKFWGKTAALACKLRRMVEIHLASHDESLKKEQLEKVSDATTRIVAEFNARGGRANFSYTDLGLMRAYIGAVRAKDVIEKAASPALTKEMKKEQIQHAIETSKAVLRKFNETGELASDSSESKRVIDVFLLVVLATETIQKAGSPKFTKNLKEEEILKALETSNRILAEFKTNEWNSKFADDDEKTLNSFLEALSATK